MRIRQALAVGLLAMTPALTGCLTYTHRVPRTRLPDVVYSTSLDQLLKQADDRFDAVHSMTLFIEMSTSTGGSMKGEVKESINFKGYIIIGKPEQIRVLLLLPVVRSKALDMASDGKSFKMLVPIRNCAIVGSDVVTNSSQKGLYSLRPGVILDSMLIRGKEDDQLVAMTQGSRIVPDPKHSKDLIEEPDYDLEFLSQPQGKVAQILRVLHVSRVNLLPHRQDIYNSEGKVATQAFYSNYQKFGDVTFPTKIVIQRPLDELGLTITVTNGTNFNKELDAGAFDVGPIPENYTTYNMDDPAVASTIPCAAHAPQSPH